jgi:hypothetical protein
MRISRKFKQLTSFTYPFGTEKLLENYLPQQIHKDEFDNYYLQIGENPTTMFTCHLDTSCGAREKVNHVIEGDFIKTDGSTILGADDKAGMIVLLYMIENQVPGLYYFFVGEEVGCVGSGKLSRNWLSTDFSKYITKVVSFDRRGTTSVITEQLFGVCCSDEFAKELCDRLNNTELELEYKPDPTGIYTDSAKFTSLVPECTNISVGYYNEHTTREVQDIEFLKRLCKAVCLIDWETLPVVRNVSNDFEEQEDEQWQYDEDDEWSIDLYSYFSIGEADDSKKMYISKSQIEKEKQDIRNWILQNDIYPGLTDLSWDGNSLYVETDTNYEFLANRMDLLEMIPELSEVSASKVRLKLN